jgi:hypothetical protein
MLLAKLRELFRCCLFAKDSDRRVAGNQFNQQRDK